MSNFDSAENNTASNCVIVGIGASAGGLDAYKELMEALPPDLGVAYVLIQHLDPNHASLMAELLTRHTHMPVQQLKETSRIQPDQVYIIPPGKFVKVMDDQLLLDPPIKSQGLRLPIDYFFRSLAQERKERAIGIILSGTGNDGTIGLREIKESGGMIMVQNTATAEHQGMPHSAIMSGLVDFAVPIHEMPDILQKYVKQPYVADLDDESIEVKSPDHFHSIISLLRAQTDYDFRSYKKGTLGRRIQRRMGLRQLVSIGEYVKLLRENPQELELLFKDLLISVTGFFREPEAWQIIESEIIAPFVAKRADDSPIRIWVAGCATGEEAYSIVISVFEQMRKQKKRCNVQVFATDLDRAAIDTARLGLYPESIRSEMSEEIFKRYFDETNKGNYRIKKRLREQVVFAVQNLIGDPPFSGMDLISCRNLMIYLNSDVQRKMLEVFHFALKNEGFLFLGASESIGKGTRLFNTLNKQWRIFQKAGQAKSGAIDFLFPKKTPNAKQLNTVPGASVPKFSLRSSTSEIAKQALLDRFAPPSVLVDKNFEVQHFHGAVRNYLTIPSGEPTTNLIFMCLEGLRSQLRSACAQCLHDKRAISVLARRVKRDEALISVKIHVEPLWISRGLDPMCLITFADQPSAIEKTEEATISAPPEDDNSTTIIDFLDQNDQFKELEYELQSTREDLQSTIEELEASNEELQSTNEELETSREELQSLNEELSTVNCELEDKVHEVEGTNNDLQNLLTSTNIATLFLDTSFRIRRFTPITGELLHILDTDIGRPIQDLSSLFKDSKMLRDARTVLANLQPVEREVCIEESNSTDGENNSLRDDTAEDQERPSVIQRWYMRRILPYRTSENKIDGVVITLSDITHLKNSTTKLAQRERQAAVIAQLGRSALVTESVSTLLREAVDLSARAVGVRFAKFLKLENNQDLRMVEGTGWKPGLVGKAIVSADLNSQAGYTLYHEGPILVENFYKEKRFSPPNLLTDHNVMSGVSAMVGPIGNPWGVFGIHHDSPSTFSMDDTNFVQAVANLVWDCIERISSRQEIARQLSEINNIYLSAPIGLGILDTSLRYVRVNETLASIHGIPASEHVGKSVREVTPAFAEILEPILQKLLTTKKPVLQHEISYPKEDGSEDVLTWLASYQPILQDGKCTAISAVVQDITEIKAARHAAAESDLRFRIAKDAAGIGIHDYDPQTDTVIWDQRVREIWGCDESNPITYETFAAGLHPDDLEAANAAVAAAMNPDGDGKYHAEYRVINPKDGLTRWIEATGSVMFKNKVAVRLVGTTQDITNRRKLELSLKNANQRKDSFIAMLSHELRNPLSPINTGIEMLKNGMDDKESEQEIIHMIQRQTQNLIELVDDLLDISRITSSKIKLRKRIFPIRESIENAIESAKSIIDERAHNLEVAIPKEDLLINGDPTRIAQIFSNLLTNAAKFTGAKGNIRLEVVRINRQIEVTVSDNGIGIDPEHRETIFQIFNQIEEAGRNVTSGLGLGLYLVNSLVELHDGKVSVESKGKDQGSTFKVVLPLSNTGPDEVSQPNSGQVVTPNTPQKLKVLVAEDNEPARRMMTMLVQKFGHEVEAAANGIEAVAKAESYRPNVILMDIGMPEMDGLEAVACIRKKDWGKGIKIVALSGWGQEEDIQKSRKAGFDQHLVKPPKMDLLRKILSDV